MEKAGKGEDLFPFLGENSVKSEINQEREGWNALGWERSQKSGKIRQNPSKSVKIPIPGTFPPSQGLGIHRKNLGRIQDLSRKSQINQERESWDGLGWKRSQKSFKIPKNSSPKDIPTFPGMGNPWKKLEKGRIYPKYPTLSHFISGQKLLREPARIK